MNYRVGLVGICFISLVNMSWGQIVPAERKKAVETKVAQELDDLEKLYKHFHANPELSLQEEKTAARLAQEIKKLGFEVTEKVGKTGVVGVFKNGTGPTVLVRADMDGLPIIEKTGLPYASTKFVRDRAGKEVGVMHACGHDVHITSWVGTARVMTALKEQWQGTLVLVAQPAEEIGQGARLMIADGLFEKFPKPDYCLALHADATLEAGAIHYTEGLAMANVDTVEVTLKGKGGHGSSPQVTIDPIVIAAKYILDLQTIVSREQDPFDPAVVTVGSIHGGTKANIIPNEVLLQITVRTTKEPTRQKVLEAIRRKAHAAALAANAPEPEVNFITDDFTPKLENDIPLTRKTVAVFEEILGKENVRKRNPILGGEDFSRFAREGKTPIFMYFLGTVDPERVAEFKKQGKPLPGMHTDAYYPHPSLAVKHGVTTMSHALLHLLEKPK